MDVQTIFITAAVMVLANGAVLANIQRDLPNELGPASNRWQIATLLIALGGGFFAFGKALPIPVLVTIANGALITGLTFYHWSIRRFYGEEPSAVDAAACVFVMAIVYWFSAVTPHFTLRLSLVGIVWVVILARTLHTLHRHRLDDPSRSRHMLVALYWLLLCFVVLRAGLYIKADLPREFTVASGGTPINLGSPIIMALLPVIGTTVFSLMCVDRMKRQLQVTATTDYLTGLSNRRILAERGESLHARALGGNGSLAVLVFDIDHFKGINDTHGHSAGDKVLVHVAGRLRALTGPDDIVVRSGGEEFVVLLDAAGKAQALARAERIRAAIAAEPCPAGLVAVAVTVSAGVAVLDRDDPDFDTLFRRADRALYRAKNEGRNRVSFA